MQLSLISVLLLVSFHVGRSTSHISRRQATTCSCYYKNSCGCYCSQPITWEEFQLLPSNFRSCERFTLAIRGGTFYSFPPDYFSRAGSVRDFALDVGDSKFTNLLDSPSPMRGVSFDNSAYLRFNNVTVTNIWNWGSFGDLRPTLPLSYCEIQVVYSTVPSLSADFGRICQGSVTVVNVMYSKMATMDDGIFTNFRKLNEVDLSGNKLQSMRRTYFSTPASELETINLSYNNIRTLPNNMFSDMPSLKKVDLKGNPITTIEESTFRAVFPHVEIIGIEGFPLNCDCRIRWLKEPGQQCGKNLYGLAGAVCNEPSRLKTRSFFNDTLPKDLVC